MVLFGKAAFERLASSEAALNLALPSIRPMSFTTTWALQLHPWHISKVEQHVLHSPDHDPEEHGMFSLNAPCEDKLAMADVIFGLRECLQNRKGRMQTLLRAVTGVLERLR